MKKNIRFMISSLLCVCLMICFSFTVQATEVQDSKITAEEAQQAYLEFVEAVSFIENDSTWEGYWDLDLWSDVDLEDSSEAYAKYVNHEGKTEEEAKEEYINFTPFVRFVYEATYLDIAKEKDAGHDEYISSYEKYASVNLFGSFIETNGGDRSEEVLAAYEKITKWQIDYIHATGGPYNFITGKTYAEEMGIDPATLMEEKDEEISAGEENAESKKEIQKEEKKQKDKKEDKPEKGIWDDTLDKLAGNLLTIVILALLSIALGVVVYIRKKNNYSDEIHEK